MHEDDTLTVPTMTYLDSIDTIVLDVIVRKKANFFISVIGDSLVNSAELEMVPLWRPRYFPRN